MTFTDEQTAITRQWLDDHWYGKARCPAGHVERWSVAGSMAFVPGFVSDDQGPRIAHERGLRFIVLTCDECGYAAFLNADTVGIGA